MSRRWDEGSTFDGEHPHGNNTLMRMPNVSALDASKANDWLEDTHAYMKHHLGVLHAEGRGRGRRWQARHRQALWQALVDGVARRLCGKA